MEPIRVDVHLTPDDLDAALRDDVRTGLRATPKVLPPKWFYDDHGCALFDKITRLPEYYPTERERQILRMHADDLARRSAADCLVELGSGTSDKTRALLDAMAHTGQLDRFIPFEVNEATLRQACVQIAEEYPGLHVHGVVGDFDHHLRLIPREGRRMIAFLGSTIGNFEPPERAQFFADLVADMRSGDTLLLGTDLVKDVDRLEAAYDDAAGVTAEFNLNVLAVMNRELDADFDLDGFEHVAFFDPVNEWIEMRLRSLASQTVRVRALDLEVSFESGEEIRTEISAKFRRERIEAELAGVGLRVVAWLEDDGGDFALSLSILD